MKTPGFNEEKRVRMPGFTADISLGPAGQPYSFGHRKSGQFSWAAGALMPQMNQGPEPCDPFCVCITCENCPCCSCIETKPRHKVLSKARRLRWR